MCQIIGTPSTPIVFELGMNAIVSVGCVHMFGVSSNLVHISPRCTSR